MVKTNTILAKLIVIFGLFAALILFYSSNLTAQSVNQGYISDEVLQKGMIVVVQDVEQGKVAAATNESLEQLKGVIVQQNDSPVTLADAGKNVFVATSGINEVLVSDENGGIKSGDYISISSLAGIGMKATDEQKLVVGRAAADFDGESGKIGSSQDPKTGKKVNFARIKVAVAVNTNPWLRDDKGNTVPKLLQKISVSIAGKPVNTQRIWMATAVFMGTAIIVGSMLYSGARSSLISVGRNPLSKAAIIRGLGQIVILSLIVFITGMFGVYLLLKL